MQANLIDQNIKLAAIISFDYQSDSRWGRDFSCEGLQHIFEDHGFNYKD